MLFRLAEDPHEQHNLAQTHPELCQQAAYYLNEWHDAMMESIAFDTDPLWTVIKEGGPYHAKGQLKKYAERLGRIYEKKACKSSPLRKLFLL